MAKKTPPVEYIPDGPIMSCLKETQLMRVQWRNKSKYFSNKEYNDNLNREFKKKQTQTQCCGRYIKE